MTKRTWGLCVALASALGLLIAFWFLADLPVTAAPRALTPIYDIQYTTTPGVDGTYPSPYDTQAVTTTGVVYAVYPGRGFCIADAAGPWHGIYVYYPGSPLPALGDEVQVAGTVDEYYGLTELTGGASYTVLSSGNPLYGPAVVNAATIQYDDLDAAEPYESVLVEVRNIEVTGAANQYGTWTFTDASAGTGKADDWGYDFEPDVGDSFGALRGALIYWFDFVVMPRNAADVVTGQPLDLAKTAPGTVAPGALFTYTLTVHNDTGTALTHVVLTDALPLPVEIADLSGGGVELGSNVVSWTLPSLADGALVSRTAVVTAPLSTTVLVNDDYVAWAGNWPTRTHGAPVPTLVNAPGGLVPIHVIQGSGLASPLDGYTDLLIEGVVVGDFQDTTTELGGFFVQEEDADADADPATSEGIFVYDDGFGVDVNLGDVVRVQGDVQEYFGLTEFTNVDSVQVQASGAAVSPAAVSLPLSAVEYLERFEGMSLDAPGVLYATETYNLGRYGEVWVSVGGRLYNPTNLVSPGAPALALQDLNDRSRLLVDDGSRVQNPATVPYLAADDTLRLGDVVSGLVGVLSYDSGYYRLQPTLPLDVDRENQRTMAPQVDAGLLRVASFNVLNYFNGDGQGGGFPTPRGADTLAEFERQRAKIITATLAIDADVVGLMEIENDGYGTYSAIQDLVAGLNTHSAPGTYAFVDFGGPVGTDEIIQGLLYKPDSVTPIGAPAVLDSSVDPTFIDTKNRPVLVQTFEHTATGQRLTVAVNHLKSKGSPCDDVGDPDLGDGQGNCNQTRTDAATALVNWLATDPTGSGDPDYLIIGDLNAYAKEDPIEAITTAGYIDLVATYLGAGAYSYVFNGQAGYLDHALATASLVPQVVDTTIWHINADEPRALDYNDYNPAYLYDPDAYRASDHDPVVVSLFPETALTLAKTVTPTAVRPGGGVTYTLSLQNGGFGLAQGLALTDTLPPAVTFSGWLTQAGAVLADGTLTWTGTLSAGEDVIIAFTATVTDAAAYAGQTVTNTAVYTSTNGGGGTAQAAFDVQGGFTIYLPLVAKNY